MLTLAEDLLLLAHDRDAGVFREPPELLRDTVLAGAVLMDLALRGRIDADLDGNLEIDPRPTGEPVLDDALAQLAGASAIRRTTIWLDLLRRDGPAIRDRTIARLVERGLVRRQDDRLLWIFATRHYPLVAEQPLESLRGRVAALLTTEDIPDPRDALLIVLADACGLLGGVLAEDDLLRAQSRIRQLARFDLIGQVLRATIDGLYDTIAKVTAFPG